MSQLNSLRYLVRAMLVAGPVLVAGCGAGTDSAVEPVTSAATDESVATEPQDAFISVESAAPPAVEAAPETAGAEAVTETAAPETAVAETTAVETAAVETASAETAAVESTAVETAAVESSAPEMHALAVTAAVTVPSGGATVYVDAVNGRDTNAGTLAAPWKTLARVATAGTTGKLAAVYLACGSIWRESLSLGATALLDGSVISAYGSSCATSKPTISGADNVSGGWALSNGIWQRTLTAGGPKVRRMFIDGASLRTAQWPRYGGVGNEFAYAAATTAGSSTVVVVGTADRPALAGRDLIGATIAIRVNPWLIEEHQVAAYNATSGAITLSSPTRYPMSAGIGYSLTDKAWMLQRPGEFHHDAASGLLKVIPATAEAQTNLNTTKVEAAVRDVVLAVSGRTGLRLNGFAVNRARLDGIRVSEAPNAQLEGLDVRQTGETGIVVVQRGALASGQRSALVANSIVSDNWQIGIDTSLAPAAEVTGNSVSDTGTIAFAGMSTAGIYSGPASLVHRNNVVRSAARGIRFTGIGNSRVTENQVIRFCTRLSDCSGIHWRGVTRTTVRDSSSVSLVQGNLVADGVLNTEGASGPGADLVVGIYLDDYSQGVTIRGNVVRNVPYGIYLHNSSHNVVDKNSVWFTTKVALRAQMDQTDGDFLISNSFTGNQLVPTGTSSGTYPTLPTVNTSLAIAYRTKAYSSPLPTTRNPFSGNQIVPLFGSSAVLAEITGAGEVQSSLTGSGWRALMGTTEQVVVPGTYALYQLVTGSELLQHGGYDSGMTGWTPYFVSKTSGATATITSSGGVGCVGPCATLKSASTSDQLYSTTPFSMLTGQMYVVRFRAGMGGTGSITFPFINRSLSPWTSLLPADAWKGTKPIGGTTGDVITFEGIFRPTSDEQARVSLRTAAPGIPVNFDSVSVKRVTGFTMGSPADWATSVGGSIAPASTVTCASLGWPSTCKAMGVNGAAVTLPLALPANTSKLLLRADSPWRR